MQYQRSSFIANRMKKNLAQFAGDWSGFVNKIPFQGRR